MDPFYLSESHPLGPRAVQPSHTCDHPRGEPEVYSQMSMVEPVREAISSTQRHNIAAPPPDDYWTPRLSPVPHIHSSQKANADLLPLDRLHNGREEEDVEPESTKFSNL